MAFADDPHDRPAPDSHELRAERAANPREPSAPDALAAAIAEIVRELAEVRATMPRCGSCGNFLAVVERVRGDLAVLGTASPSGEGEAAVAAAGAACERLGGWLDEARDRVKTTNHCEICVPAGPYERFAAALGRRP